jgi:hypothetical protein
MAAPLFETEDLKITECCGNRVALDLEVRAYMPWEQGGEDEPCFYAYEKLYARECIELVEKLDYWLALRGYARREVA